MSVSGVALFAGLVDACVVETGSALPGVVKSKVVSIDLGADSNGVFVLAALCEGGWVRVVQCGSLGDSGLSSCWDRIAVQNGVSVESWVMGWDAEVKQSLFNISPAEWLRQRGQQVRIVRESVSMSLSRLGRALGRGPSDVHVQIDASCERLVSSLRHYKASPEGFPLERDETAWARHMTDALRYLVTPDWRHLIGRHVSALAAAN